MFEVTTDRRYGKLIAEIDRNIKDAEVLIARESVKSLQDNRSLWPDVGNSNSPYATGFSKERFSWRRSGGKLGITNTATSKKGYPYPDRVNNDSGFADGRHYQAVQRTIKKDWRNIVRRVARKADKTIR